VDRYSCRIESHDPQKAVTAVGQHLIIGEQFVYMNEGGPAGPPSFAIGCNPEFLALGLLPEAPGQQADAAQADQRQRRRLGNRSIDTVGGTLATVQHAAIRR